VEDLSYRRLAEPPALFQNPVLRVRQTDLLHNLLQNVFMLLHVTYHSDERSPSIAIYNEPLSMRTAGATSSASSAGRPRDGESTHRFAVEIVMKRALIAFALFPLAPAAVAQPQQSLERHEFVLRDFHTESGAVLPEAHLVYTTLGTMNAAGDNAILLPSHYMANFNGYNWLIGGAGRALDPARDFLIL